MKASTGRAGIVRNCTVPRDPSITETRMIVSLSGASTMLRKS